jgi:hypothetical protein
VKYKGYHLTYSRAKLVFFWVVLPEQALLSPEHERHVTNSTKSARRRHLSGNLEVLLEGTLDLLLLGGGLVSTVTELGRGVDPLELDLLERTAGGVDEHGLAEGHDTLLDTRDGTLEENEVVLDLTVADEATHTGKCVSNVFRAANVNFETYGVMRFLLTSKSVEAEPSSSPLPIR